MSARRFLLASVPGKLALPALALAAILHGGTSCSGYDADERVDVTCPPFENFRSVSAVLERRCGTLDCHGHVARPLRIYGQPGLRRPEEPDSENIGNFEEYYPGGGEPTTDAEVEDNYRSVCGLEPEMMNAVVKEKADPEVLSLIRKARLRERHKGGRVFNKGREGDACLVNWLTFERVGDSFVGNCEEELRHP